MTIRGGGRARDPRIHAHPYEPSDHLATRRKWDEDPRRAPNGRRFRDRGGSGLVGLLRFIVFAFVLGGLVLAVLLTVLRPVVSDTLVSWGYDNPAALRIPFVADLVKERLGAALTRAPSNDARDVTFTVRDGDTIAKVADRLEAAGLVTDSRAFVFQATMRDLAPRLEAGDFRLAKNMTPDQVVTALTKNRITIVLTSKTFRESLRIDQMAAFIQTWEEDLAVDAEAFRDLATKPTRELLDDYPWVEASGLPEGAPLEGYLFPAAYDLTPETTAEELIRMMLDRFIKEVGRERVAVATFYERLTLASIVEREAQLPEERPQIAGVYQNRLDGTGPDQILNADPTVIYAADTVALADIPFEQWDEYVFWEVPEGVALADIELPEALERYNTYRNRGLPPGPICAPGLASIEAALEPDTEAGYRYFVLIPDGEGKHDFSKSIEEHNQKLRDYGYL